MKLLLVGTHFNKPAKLLLLACPQHLEVELRREPSNPYDANAVEVWLSTSDLDEATLREHTEELEGQGYTIPEVLTQRSWRLGHVGASGGKPLEKARKGTGEELEGNRELLEAYEWSELPRGKLEARSDGTVVVAVE